jgi:hypothetical protein
VLLRGAHITTHVTYALDPAVLLWLLSSIVSCPHMINNPLAPLLRLSCPALSQVLHCSAILAPNQDTAFMLSLVWTTLQMLLASFFISFAEVGLPAAGQRRVGLQGCVLCSSPAVLASSRACGSGGRSGQHHWAILTASRQTHMEDGLLGTTAADGMRNAFNR